MAEGAPIASTATGAQRALQIDETHDASVAGLSCECSLFESPPLLYMTRKTCPLSSQEGPAPLDSLEHECDTPALPVACPDVPPSRHVAGSAKIQLRWEHRRCGARTGGCPPAAAPADTCRRSCWRQRPPNPAILLCLRSPGGASSALPRHATVPGDTRDAGRAAGRRRSGRGGGGALALRLAGAPPEATTAAAGQRVGSHVYPPWSARPARHALLALPGLCSLRRTWSWRAPLAAWT